MRASISKSEIKGKVTAPSSKSYTIRGLMCAALARGKSEIVSPLGSDDTEASLDVLRKVGIDVNPQEDCWRVTGGNFREPETAVIGSDKHGSVFIWIADARPRHATIALGDSGAMLRHVATAGRTRVDGNPVKQWLLRDGDVIEIGTARLRYRERRALAASRGAAPAVHPKV